MASMSLCENLSRGLERTLANTLIAGEVVLVKLEGASGQEALVCTDRRVVIIKRWLGSDVFQFPYASISSAEVKMGMLLGYFELTAGGVPMNTAPKTDPSKLPNCIGLGRYTATQFRRAASFIMNKVVEAQRSVVSAPALNVRDDHDILGKVERLAALHRGGTLSDEEFTAAKRRLLSPPS